jgi:hypothetical protein
VVLENLISQFLYNGAASGGSSDARWQARARQGQ